MATYEDFRRQMRNKKKDQPEVKASGGSTYEDFKYQMTGKRSSVDTTDYQKAYSDYLKYLNPGWQRQASEALKGMDYGLKAQDREYRNINAARVPTVPVADFTPSVSGGSAITVGNVSKVLQDAEKARKDKYETDMANLRPGHVISRTKKTLDNIKSTELMSDKERDLYAYYISQGDKKTAAQYLDDLNLSGRAAVSSGGRSYSGGTVGSGRSLDESVEAKARKDMYASDLAALDRSSEAYKKGLAEIEKREKFYQVKKDNPNSGLIINKLISPNMYEQQNKNGTEFLTDQERALYAYYLGLGEKDKAAQYLEDIQLNARRRGEILKATEQDARNNPVLNSISSAWYNTGKPIEGIYDLTDKLTGDKLPDYNTFMLSGDIANRQRDTVREKINNPVGGFLYDTGMSAVDSLMAALLPGGLGSLALGASAMRDAMRDAADKGATTEQIVMQGLAQGIAEALFEKISIGELKRFKEVPINGKKDILFNFLKSTFTNASEEGLTELSNVITDYLIMGKNGDNPDAKSIYEAVWNSLGRIGLAALGGGLMGGPFSLAGSVNSYVDSSLRGRNVTSEDLKAAMQYGREYDNADINRMAAAIDAKQATGSKVTDFEKGNLMKNVDYAKAQEQNKVLNMLRELQRKAAEEKKTSEADKVTAEENKTATEGTQERTEAFDRETKSFYGKNGQKVLEENWARNENKMSRRAYENAIYDSYMQGKEHRTFEPTERSSVLSVEERKLAYNAGVADRWANVDKGVFAPADNPGVIDSDDARDAYTKDKAGFEYADTVAKLFGAQINYNYGIKGNGLIMDGNKISLSPNSAISYKSVANHEFTHMLEITKGYEAYRDYVMGTLYKNDKAAVDAEVSRIIDLYNRNGVKLDYEGAVKEMLADAAEDFLNSEESINKFMRALGPDERTVVQKIIDFFKEAIAKLKAAIRDTPAETQTGKMLRADLKAMQQAEDLWIKAAAELKKGEAKKSQGKAASISYSATSAPDFKEAGYSYDSNGDIVTHDGKTYAFITEKMFSPADIKNDLKVVKDIVNESLSQLVRSEPYIIKSTNQKVYVEGDFAGEYLYSKDMNYHKDSKPGVKLNAFEKAEEMIENAWPQNGKSPLWKKNTETKHAIDAKNGWLYYNTGVAIKTQSGINLYKGILNLRIDPRNRACVYDITKLKMTSELHSLRSDNKAPMPNNIVSPSQQNASTKSNEQYSITEAAKETALKAEQYFGTTSRISEMGYLDVNGKYLDFSGRKQGSGGGGRYVDHRDIASADESLRDDTWSGPMINFMKMGNIRLIPETAGIDLSVKPNENQIAPLRSYIRSVKRSEGYFMLDISALNGDNITTKEYDESTSVDAIMEDINAYFDKGIIPFDENETQYSITEDSEGRKLSKRQQAFFADDAAELKDNNGSLKRYYHGTPGAGFTVFEKADDGISYFFTDNKKVAKSYSGVDFLENPDKPMSIDELNEALWNLSGAPEDETFFKEYEGKIELWDMDAGEVTKQKTFDSLKEAQNWLVDEELVPRVYEGMGNASNYEVYLHATNPFVYDAKGKMWNELEPAEYSKHFSNVEIFPGEEGKFEVDYEENGKAYHKVYSETELDKIFGDGTGTMVKISNAGEEFFENVYFDKNGNRLYSNTREIAKYAKANGYDSVVINNVVDYGNFDMFQDEPSQVVVVFTPEQIKSIYNMDPTDNPDIRYSITDLTPEEIDKKLQENKKLKSKNKHLEKLYENAKKQIRLTKEFKASDVAVNKIAKETLKEFNSTFPVADFANTLHEVYEYIYNNERKGKEVNIEEVSAALTGVMEKVLEQSVYMDETDQAVRDALKGKTLIVTEDLKKNITDWNDFRREASMFKIRNGETSNIDSVYDELHDQFPWLFDTEQNVTLEDMLYDLVDTYEAAGPKSAKYGDMKEIAMQTAINLIDRYSEDIMEKPTFADKKKEELKRLKAEHKKELFEARSDLADTFAKVLSHRELDLSKYEDKMFYKKVNKEQKERREAIEDIIKYAGRLNTKLFSKFEKNYIPTQYISNIARLLKAIDLSTNISDTKVAEQRAKYKEMYERIIRSKQGDDYMIPSGDEIPSSVQEVINLLGDKPVRNLGSEVLKRVSTILKGIDEKVSLEQKKREEHIESIEKIVARLRERLFANNEKKHIPAQYVNNVAMLLKAIDLNSNVPGKQVAEQLAKYKDMYKKVLESNQGEDHMLALDEDLPAYVEEVISMLNDKPIRNYNSIVLERVKDILNIVEGTVKNANNAFLEDQNAKLTQKGSEILSKLDKMSSKPTFVFAQEGVLRSVADLLTVYNVTAPMFYDRLGGPLQESFKTIRNAEGKYADNVEKAEEYAIKMMRKYNFNDWYSKRALKKSAKTFNLGGRNITLDRGQIMSLYVTWQREAGRYHIEHGGITSDTQTKAGKLFVKSNSEAIAISEADYKMITDTLTQEQKDYADAMRDYLAKECSKQGNEVTLALWQIKKYGEDKYFPIPTTGEFNYKTAGTVGDTRIKHSSFTKTLVQKASNPITLYDFMTIWSSHVEGMARYNAYTLPLEGMTRLWNYKEKLGGSAKTKGSGQMRMSVRSELKRVYGAAYNTYIDHFLNDVNGSRPDERGNEVGSNFMSLMKKGAVMGNARVVVQQPSAIVRAFAYIDPKYFTNKQKGDYDELAKWNSAAKMKRMGFFDTNMGGSIVDELKKGETRTAKEAVWDFIKNERGTRDEVLSKGAEMADELTWAAIWRACKAETAATTDLKQDSEAFMKHASARFTEIVDYTQVYDSVFEKSDIMRSSDTFAKMVTAFMSEPTKTYSMLWRAATKCIDAGDDKELKKAASKYVKKALIAILGSWIVNDALTSIIDVSRKGTDNNKVDKKYEELNFIENKLTRVYIKTWLDSFLGEPESLVPYLKDIMSIFSGYEVKRTDMQLFQNLYWGANKIKKKVLEDPSSITVDDTVGLAGSISAFFGIPVSNVYRDLKSAYGTAEKMVKDLTGITEKEESFEGRLDKYYEDNDLVALQEGKSNSVQEYNDLLYESVENGKLEDLVAYGLANGRTEDQIFNAINSKFEKQYETDIAIAAAAYKSGEIDAYNEVVDKLTRLGYSQSKTVEKAITKKVKQLNKEEAPKEEAPGPDAKTVLDNYYSDTPAKGSKVAASEKYKDIVSAYSENNRSLYAEAVKKARASGLNTSTVKAQLTTARRKSLADNADFNKLIREAMKGDTNFINTYKKILKEYPYSLASMDERKDDLAAVALKSELFESFKAAVAAGDKEGMKKYGLYLRKLTGKELSALRKLATEE